MKNISTLLFCFGLTVITAFAQSPGLTEQLDRFFQKCAVHGYSGNVLVERHDSVILSRGYGWQDIENEKKETDETIFDIGSITKQFTAAAILKLEVAGKLKVADKIGKFFPDAPADKKEITLHQLLTHTAGFPDAIGDDYDLISSDGFIKLAFSTALNSKSGEEYRYSNVGYSILGIIIEKVSGKSYEQYLHDEIFLPAGMMHTGYLLPGFKNEELAVAYRNGVRWGTMLEHPWSADGPGWHLKANGGILTTLRDMYKWYLAIQNKTVLPANEIAKYFFPYVKEDSGETYYGYGWVVEPKENGDTLYWHNGGNGAFNTFMSFDLKHKQVTIISSNTNEKIADDYALQVHRILNGDYRETNEKIISARTGDYTMPNGDSLHVSFDEMDQLILGFHSHNALMALASEGTEDTVKANKYDQRTALMLTNALSGNYEELAKAWGSPIEDIKRDDSSFWSSHKETFGVFKDINVLGSVSRSHRSLYFTFVEVNFEHGVGSFIYAWKGDRLEDMRPQKNFNKIFSYKSGNIYYAPNNNKTIEFASESFLIKNNEGVVIKAIRVK